MRHKGGCRCVADMTELRGPHGFRVQLLGFMQRLGYKVEVFRVIEGFAVEAYIRLCRGTWGVYSVFFQGFGALFTF